MYWIWYQNPYFIRSLHNILRFIPRKNRFSVKHTPQCTHGGRSGKKLQPLQAFKYLLLKASTGKPIPLSGCQQEMVPFSPRLAGSPRQAFHWTGTDKYLCVLQLLGDLESALSTQQPRMRHKKRWPGKRDFEGSRDYEQNIYENSFFISGKKVPETAFFEVCSLGHAVTTTFL